LVVCKEVGLEINAEKGICTRMFVSYKQNVSQNHNMKLVNP